MKIDVEEKYLTNLLISKNSLKEVAELFGVSEEQLSHPNCGLWLKDQIKQLLTSATLYKSLVKKQTDNGAVETFHQIDSGVTKIDDQVVE